MLVTKKQLNKIISNYLNERVEDPLLMSPSDIPDHPKEKEIKEATSFIWDRVKNNPGDYHFPVYAFLKYLFGDGSDFKTEELAKTQNGQAYIAELTKILDTAALPFDNRYEDGIKKNGYAISYKGKDLSFYVLDYEVFLGPGGKSNINEAWKNAFINKGGLNQHLGVTIGQAGVGGKQIAQDGITVETLQRPDFHQGYHRLVNEFDFTRLAPSEAKEMNFGEILKFYLKDFKAHASKGVSATLTYLAGRSLNTVINLAGINVAPYNFDLVIKSNISEWPDLTEYPFPKSGRPFVGKQLELVPGQLKSKSKEMPYDKAVKTLVKDMDIPNPRDRSPSIRNAPPRR